MPTADLQDKFFGAGGSRIFVGQFVLPKIGPPNAHRNASHGEDCVERAGTKAAAQSAAPVFHM